MSEHDYKKDEFHNKNSNLHADGLKDTDSAMSEQDNEQNSTNQSDLSQSSQTNMSSNWETDEWSLRSSSVEEDDPLVKLARLMAENEKAFENTAQGYSSQGHLSQEAPVQNPAMQNNAPPDYSHQHNDVEYQPQPEFAHIPSNVTSTPDTSPEYQPEAMPSYEQPTVSQSSAGEQIAHSSPINEEAVTQQAPSHIVSPASMPASDDDQQTRFPESEASLQSESDMMSEPPRAIHNQAAHNQEANNAKAFYMPRANPTPIDTGASQKAMQHQMPPTASPAAHPSVAPQYPNEPVSEGADYEHQTVYPEQRDSQEYPDVPDTHGDTPMPDPPVDHSAPHADITPSSLLNVEPHSSQAMFEQEDQVSSAPIHHAQSDPMSSHTNADAQTQHETFAPPGHTEQTSDHDFDVSRLPKAIRPVGADGQPQLTGLHGHAGDNFPVDPQTDSQHAAFGEAAVMSGATQTSEQPTQYTENVMAPVLGEGNLTGAANADPSSAANTIPDYTASSVQPASELPLPSSQMPQQDYSYLREVEDLRVPSKTERQAESDIGASNTMGYGTQAAGTDINIQDTDPPWQSQIGELAVDAADNTVYEIEENSSSRTILMITAGIVGLLVLGVTGFFGYNAIYSDSSDSDAGSPPVITSSKDPVRILPDGQQLEVMQNPVNSSANTDVTVEGQVNDEQPSITLNPNIDNDRQVRIVEPDSVNNNQVISPRISPTAEELGPRPVRTFIVRPDGTIINSQAETPGQSDNAVLQPRSNQTSQPVATNTVNIDSALPRPRPSSDLNQNVNQTNLTPTGRAQLPDPPQFVVTTPSETDLTNTDLTNNETPSDVALNLPQTQVAPEPVVNQTPTNNGAFMVQVSSQRSEESALSVFQRLQQRFPSVLGSLSPDIARADLGARGVFYRVRVGPMETRAQAGDFCETLKAIGGDCIVVRR